MSAQPQETIATEDFDLQIPSGRIHARRYGSNDGPLVLAVPGLSANLTGFDYMGERLAPLGMNLVAVDLRGRGRSEVTPVGTYTWPNHAADVFAIAEELGHERFSILGQSMGAAVAMVCASSRPEALDRVVLIDVAGCVDEAAKQLLMVSVSRLGTVYPSVDAVLGLVKGMGMIPWDSHWENYFRYDLKEVEGGVTTRSNRDAVLEDNAYGTGVMAFGSEAGMYSLWKHLTMPVLLLRATQPMHPTFGGMIIPDQDRQRFAEEVPTATVVEVEANHYGINTHPDSVQAIKAFFNLARDR